MKKAKEPKITEESTDFFESMPFALNDSPWRAGHFVYRDDATIDHYEENTSGSIENEIKTTSIITLVLVLITAVALGLLIWKGLVSVKGDVNQVTSTTLYEL
jgi:hypothetical protein